MRIPPSALPLLAALVASVEAAAQTPAAPETVLNTYTTGQQAWPSLGMDRLGNFVVTWQGPGVDGSGMAAVGRRFDRAGTPLGAEFVANVSTLGSQTVPDVAVDHRGDFVVSWTDFANGPEIRGRRFDRGGAALGGEFLVNQYTTGVQDDAAIAIDGAGNFVVVWADTARDGDGYGVFGRRFEAGGAPRGAEFQVNTYVTGNQRNPDVAVGADGGFVVVFQGPDNFSNGVHARRFDAGGNPLGAEFALTTSSFSQFSPTVAARPDGGFVVAWTSYGQDNGHNAVVRRVFDAAGNPATSESVVNTYTTNAQSSPMVAVDGNGAFVVAWSSYAQDGAHNGAFARRFDAAGGPMGGEFQLNAYTTGAQMPGAVAADTAGNFTAVWHSEGQDPSSGGIVGRRYQGFAPISVAADSAGNGVLEAGEAAVLAPAWRNTGAAALTVTASLQGFTGPAPGVYTALDSSATYGTVAAGTTEACSASGDCYMVTVTSSSRPALHWDASALEVPAGAPATDGIAKRWTLHLGDSFTDVPRGNPFYRFVETLLHQGVTTGCGGTSFCPASPVTREQMCVFVLVAREGPGYLPMECGIPVFGDVPAASPFCRWIEELARRGVVGGCGGGNYCPSSSVTREQMAVFVLRVQDPASSPPACAPPNMYADVPETSPFCRWIEELTRRGVVSGCGGGNYCPAAPVTREQMGVFLSVTFGLTLYGP